MNVWEVIVSILTGLSICIPLVIKLVQVTREAVQKGKWSQLIKMIAEYMTEAEKNFETGAERKEWVMSMIRVSTDQIEYPISVSEWGKISEMIDDLCDMARIVNGPKEAE